MIRALALILALPAHAQAVAECDGRWQANARNVVWDDGPLTLADDAVRIVKLDTGGEPACCSVHLMLLLPGPDGGAERCALVSADPFGGGYFDLSLSDARFDLEGRTLRAVVPGAVHDGEGPVARRVDMTVDLGTGRIRFAYQ